MGGQGCTRPEATTIDLELRTPRIDAPCAGRCRRRTLHHLRARLPAAGRLEALDLTCLACSTDFRLWLVHAEAGGQTGCGLPLGAPLRTSRDAARVSCTICQRGLFTSLELDLAPLKFSWCLICRSRRVFQRRVWRDHLGAQVVCSTCDTCQTSAFWGGVVHLRSEVGSTRCGAVDAGASPLARRPWVLPLAPCVACQAAERARSLTPDWRPLSALAEDFYAL